MNDDALSRLCPTGRRLIGVLIQSRPQAEPFIAQTLTRVASLISYSPKCTSGRFLRTTGNVA
jgi:hypothetical protein